MGSLWSSLACWHRHRHDSRPCNGDTSIGFIGVPGGLILGLAGGLACYIAVDILRVRMKIDDSLDVFAVHGTGDILGSLLVA